MQTSEKPQNGVKAQGLELQHVTSWHSLTPEQVIAHLQSSATGLSAQEAGSRLARYGFNRIPEPRGPSLLSRIVAQVHNLLIYVLLAAALGAALMQRVKDALVILAVVVVNALAGCCQSNGNSSPVWRNSPNPGLALTHDGAPLSQGG